MNNYKAIIFDLDGTAIPMVYEGMPSLRLIEAVKKVQKKICISTATGRSLPMLHNIFKALDLTDPCVILGGTQIVNPKSGEILWEKRLSQEQVQKVIDVMKPYPYLVGLSDEIVGAPAKKKVIKGSETMVCMWGAPEEDAMKLFETINKLENVAAHTPGSWQKGMLDIHVTHKTATKKHAIEELIKILKLEKKNVIGVGDQNNDIPLFESVGLKVAMGNATDLLKSKADYVTGTVEEDGLAQVIEKFILN